MSKAINLVRIDKPNDTKFQNHIKHLNYNTFTLNLKDSPIVFTITDPSISKADIVMLDIINSNTDRDVYFSAYSNDNYLFLDDYLLLEGLAYRLESKNPLSKDNVMDINANTMFDNILRNYCFDNFDEKGVYFNELERNISVFLADNLGQVANKLLLENQKDKALIIADKLLNTFDINTFDYTSTLADMAIVYQACGNIDKADNLMTIAVQRMNNFLNIYNNGTIRYQAENRLLAKKTILSYIEICLTTEDYGFENLRTKVSEAFFESIRPFMAITQRQRQMMSLQEDYYFSEIEDLDQMVGKIKNFASYYEEEL